ncbi:MAG: ABC transporter substrate-binding protein [Anaerolineaceae bacterium]|nr:ABC transporter substrate-binding protein [Anaerolineaceae bacterium]
MKALLRVVTIILMISFLTACAQATEAPASAPEVPAGTEAPVAATEAPLSAQEEWLKVNQLGPYDTGVQDWAAIEAAAKAEGELLVYANSSKVEKAAEGFMEKYPEIKVQAFDLGGDDVLLKTVEEQKAGAFTGDVWASSGGAELVGNVLPKKYVWRFVPDSAAAVTPEEYTQPLLMSRLGTSVWAYNSELNDTCPISNIWELTQPEWKGKIFIEDPLNDASTLSKLITIAAHPDEMKAAYVALYGSEPVLDEDTPDAGWLWLKRFAQNGPIPESGGDEVDAAFATPGMTESYMALGSYSNYPDVLDGNLAFEPCWGMTPIVGIQSQSYLGILNQAPHPNAAKLWIKYITSEEGREPWAKFGTYFPDSTYVVPEGQKTLEEIQTMTWLIAEQYAYDHLVEARDFYLINLGK